MCLSKMEHMQAQSGTVTGTKARKSPSVRWTTKEGHAQFLNILEDNGFCLVSIPGEKLTAKSKPIIECQSCGDQLSSFVDNMKRGYFPGCSCRGNLRSTSQAGEDNIRSIVEDHGFRLVKTCRKPGGRHAVVECLHCSERNCFWLQRVKRGKFACACNKVPTWDSAQGRERLIEAIEKSRFDLLEPLPPFINSSFKLRFQLKLKCTDCKQTVTSSIQDLIRDHTGCSCSRTSEMKACWELASILKMFPEKELDLVTEFKDPLLKGIGGNPLRFDIAIVDKVGHPMVFVEIDGPHHFIRGFWGTDSHTIEHDLKKEKYAADHFITMLRIEASVIRSAIPWEEWLKDKVTVAIDRRGAAIHRLSKGSHYTSGEYASLRAGS